MSCKDWADANFTHRDCFDFIQNYYDLSFMSALKYINDELKLGLGHTIERPKPIKAELKEGKLGKKKKKVKKERPQIEFKVRKFDDRDRIFWSQYGIKRYHLMKDHVFPVLWFKFWSNKKEDWIIIRPIDVAYAYTDFKSGNIKIYPTATDLENDTNPIATYAITATYDGSYLMQTYQVKKL